jgi:PAS domain S-box-containing protein
MAHIARADGYRVWYNQRWYDYTGSTPQEMEGWGWQSVHDPALLPRDMAQWHAGITAGEPFEMEFPLRGADGSYREFMTLATPQKDAGGQVIRWITTNTDITERKRATEQFRLALEAAPTGMLMMNESGIIVLVNAQIEAVFGYPREELLGQRLEMLVPERFRSLHPGRRKAFFGDPQTRAMGAGRELYGLHKDGTEVPIEIGLNPLQTSDGHFVLSSIADITARKRADDALAKVANELERRVITRTAELKERECLLQEIHHRVKNNLQVIASLINMQIRGLEDESTRTALRDCQSRVVTMAKIHEMLYQSADYARVPFARYTRDLAARVLSASGTSPGHIALQLDLEDVSLPVAQAIPCGLILNELVANSLKHAFPNAARGVIHVELRVAPDRSVFLSVSDDGIGMPPALDLTTATSLGVQLVMNLVEQLEGHLEIVRRPGSTFRITFPPESVA